MSALSAAWRPRISATLWLVLAWTLTLGHGGSNFRACTQFYIGGSHIRPEVVGSYRLLAHTHNHRLVYKRPCAGLSLYNNGSHWVIGPHEGSHVHYVIAGKGHVTYPRDVTAWRSWIDVNSTFVPDDRLFMSCTDIVGSCQSFTIRGPDVPPGYSGPYDKVGYHSNHTAFKHRQDNIYIYHSNDTECARWLAGPSLGGSQVSMYSLSVSPYPWDGRSLWTIIHGPDNWQQSYSVRLECTGDGAGSPCGRRVHEPLASPLLLGGSTAYHGKWPFMVSYRRADGVHKCGGALVGRRWVVTAGHCVSGADLANETILLGAHDLDTASEPTATVLSIRATHVHPEFVWVESPFRLDNDVALIELSDDVTLTDYIQPVCIPPHSEQFPFSVTNPTATTPSDHAYTECQLTGWGRTDLQSDVGGALQELPVVSLVAGRLCYDTYFASLGAWMRTARGVCVFGKDKGRMCKGDSGSPMFCRRGDRWTLMGLGGWSLSDCALYLFHYPSVYTDLAVYADWLVAVMHGRDTW